MLCINDCCGKSATQLENLLAEKSIACFTSTIAVGKRRKLIFSHQIIMRKAIHSVPDAKGLCSYAGNLSHFSSKKFVLDPAGNIFPTGTNAPRMKHFDLDWNEAL